MPSYQKLLKAVDRTQLERVMNYELPANSPTRKMSSSVSDENKDVRLFSQSANTVRAAGVVVEHLTRKSSVRRFYNV